MKIVYFCIYLKTADMEDNRNVYESPMVEIIETSVECGFATSGELDGFGENNGQW